jgi:hypothetical protein
MILCNSIYGASAVLYSHSLLVTNDLHPSIGKPVPGKPDANQVQLDFPGDT